MGQQKNEDNKYHLTELPPWAPWYSQADNAKHPNDKLKWATNSGFAAPPALGERVLVNMNSFGPSTVIAYFQEYGFLGVEVKCDKRPDWHVKQNGDKRPHPMVFGSEIKPLVNVDLEPWLEGTDPSVKPRRRIEREILTRTVDALLGAGYRVGVSLERGYDIGEMLMGSRDRDKIIEEAWAGDDCHLFAQPAEGPTVEDSRVRSVGWVFLVYGNDGYDTISDYTTGLDEVLKPVLDYCNKAEEEGR